MITVRAIMLALLAIAASFPAHAQWQRIFFSGKGGGTDIASAHALSYFIANAFLRDDGDDLCAACTPEDKAKSVLKYAIRTVVRPVGVLAGYRVIDVLCYLSSRVDGNPTQVKWKFVLVQVGPDRYTEIFHLQAFYSTISIAPSRIIRSGNEAVLASMDLDGGNGGGCWEGYWWFDDAGPHSLDFSSLEAAIKDRVPKNTRFGIGCASLDLEMQRVRSGVQRSNAACHACDWIGNVTARFQLTGPIAKPLAISFQPEEPWRPPDPITEKK